jgi:hypothetical protein
MLAGMTLLPEQMLAAMLNDDGTKVAGCTCGGLERHLERCGLRDVPEADREAAISAVRERRDGIVVSLGKEYWGEGH